jgi:hypothetical protein
MTGTTRRPHPQRKRRILLVLLLVAFINLPILHSTWTRWKVERSGTVVTATVVDDRVTEDPDGDRYWLAFTFPEEIDPDQEVWPAEVEQGVYDDAVASEQLEVKVIEGQPAAYEAAGQVRHWFGLVITLLADLILVVMVLLFWLFGRRSRPLPLRIAAIEDVERCGPGGVLEQIEGTLYLVRGEVAEMEDGEIVLDLGDQDVVVVLDGHLNPVGYQQPAQVRGRLLE